MTDTTHPDIPASMDDMAVEDLVLLLPIPGYEPFAIHRHTGAIYNRRTGKRRMPYQQVTGYCVIVLDHPTIPQKRVTFAAHRLIATMLLDPPDDPSKTQVDHIDGNKANNRPSNLRWVTPKENVQAAWERNGKPIPDECAVRNILTGDVFYFSSTHEAWHFLRDATPENALLQYHAVRIRFLQGPTVIRSDMFQYRLIKNDQVLNREDYVWPDVRSWRDGTPVMAGRSRAVRVRYPYQKDRDGKPIEEVYEKSIDAARAIGLSPAALGARLNNSDYRVIYPAYVQVMWEDVHDPFPDVYPYWLYELSTYTGAVYKPIVVIHPDGVVDAYAHGASCARLLEIGVTTLHWRLNASVVDPTKAFDGKHMYYLKEYYEKHYPDLQTVPLFRHVESELP